MITMVMTIFITGEACSVVHVCMLVYTIVLNELSPVRQLPGASTRARVEEIEKSADKHIGYECYE